MRMFILFIFLKFDVKIFVGYATKANLAPTFNCFDI